MLRDVIKDDSYFVIYLGDGNYATWVNDCAWHTTNSVASATKLSEDEVGKAIKELTKKGYDTVTPKAVDVVFNVYDVPKTSKRKQYTAFDVHMASHPYYLYPAMAKKIIELKTDYLMAKELSNLSRETVVLRLMCRLIQEYSEKGVQFCPRCNKIEDGVLVTPSRFGMVMRWTKIFNSEEGFSCDYCHYQDFNRIEHWG